MVDVLSASMGRYVIVTVLPAQRRQRSMHSQQCWAPGQTATATALTGCRHATHWCAYTKGRVNVDGATYTCTHGGTHPPRSTTRRSRKRLVGTSLFRCRHRAATRKTSCRPCRGYTAVNIGLINRQESTLRPPSTAATSRDDDAHTTSHENANPIVRASVCYRCRLHRPPLSRRRYYATEWHSTR